jgi:hypothetical protein
MVVSGPRAQDPGLVFNHDLSVERFWEDGVLYAGWMRTAPLIATYALAFP